MGHLPLLSYDLSLNATRAIRIRITLPLKMIDCLNPFDFGIFNFPEGV